MEKRCYIKSAVQISCQKSLSEEWINAPVFYQEKYVRAVEPDYKEFIKPAEARRMGRIMKRATCSSLSALQKAGLSMPDAIITGTGMGCTENSEKFLIDMGRFGESCLKPTLFMQSTHNTISSMIAISLGCHGYNNTYSHNEISFDSALLDAWIQIKSGSIDNALVGAHDEVTPLIAKTIEAIKPQYSLISESSVSMVLSESPVEALCEVESVNILHHPSLDEILSLCTFSKDTVVMTGLNGNDANNACYQTLLKEFHGNCILEFKPTFGDGFSASSLGVYASAMILKTGIVPNHMLTKVSAGAPSSISEILFINGSEDRSWSIIKLKRI